MSSCILHLTSHLASEVEWSTWRPGGRDRPQRWNWGLRGCGGELSSEVELSMRRPEGAIELRGGIGFCAAAEAN